MQYASYVIFLMLTSFVVSLMLDLYRLTPFLYDSTTPFMIEYIVPNPLFYINMVPVVIASQCRPPISPQTCVGDSYVPTRLDHHWHVHKPSVDLSILCMALVNGFAHWTPTSANQ